MDWGKKIDIISAGMDKAGCPLSEDQRMILAGSLCYLDNFSDSQEIEDIDIKRGWVGYLDEK